MRPGTQISATRPDFSTRYPTSWVINNGRSRAESYTVGASGKPQRRNRAQTPRVTTSLLLSQTATLVSGQLTSEKKKKKSKSAFMG